MLKDIEPISNAVVKECNNGFVKGTNNKLKMIKQQSYGGCKLELLRAKIHTSIIFIKLIRRYRDEPCYIGIFNYRCVLLCNTLIYV